MNKPLMSAADVAYLVHQLMPVRDEEEWRRMFVDAIVERLETVEPQSVLPREWEALEAQREAWRIRALKAEAERDDLAKKLKRAAS